MHLHIKVAPVVLWKALVSASPDPEQGDLAKDITVAKRPAHEPIVEADPEPHVRGIGKGTVQCVNKGSCHPLVRVEKQDPGGLEIVVAECPVALLRELAVPPEVEDLRTGHLGDLTTLVHAS